MDSVRKQGEGEVTADLVGFLTSDPNAGLAAGRPKAMSVILTEPEAFGTGLNAPCKVAAELRRALQDGDSPSRNRGLCRRIDRDFADFSAAPSGCGAVRNV